MTSRYPLLMLFEALCANEAETSAAGQPDYGEGAIVLAPRDEALSANGCTDKNARVLLFPLAGPLFSTSEQPDYAVVVLTTKEACAYLVEPRLAYRVRYAEMTAGQLAAWQEDLREHRLVPYVIARDRYGASRSGDGACGCSEVTSTLVATRADSSDETAA